jgi:hypothetical protein
MGHSMGAGPILSASPELQKLGYSVSGVVVIDVVEGGSQPRCRGLMSRNRSRGSTSYEIHHKQTTIILQIGRRCHPLAVSSYRSCSENPS